MLFRSFDDDRSDRRETCTTRTMDGPYRVPELLHTLSPVQCITLSKRSSRHHHRRQSKSRHRPIKIRSSPAKRYEQDGVGRPACTLVRRPTHMPLSRGSPLTRHLVPWCSCSVPEVLPLIHTVPDQGVVPHPSRDEGESRTLAIALSGMDRPMAPGANLVRGEQRCVSRAAASGCYIDRTTRTVCIHQLRDSRA